MIRIYIPLCFYFIRVGNLDGGLLIQFTFHYASTLSSLIDLAEIDYNQFTFHYASTLSRKTGDGNGLYAAFTFHYASTLSDLFRGGADRLQYLHSTMLLLYPAPTSGGRPRASIYIPLCFYFIIPAPQSLPTALRIYIPLCFYFIAVAPDGMSMSVRIYIPLCFYFIVPGCLLPPPGSGIYIPLCFYFISACLLSYPYRPQFTFHYASTLSELVCISEHTGAIIYIPLCFYFIQEEEIGTAEESIFTFHYASTLSVQVVSTVIESIHLHSTMLLLYRGSLRRRISFTSIYIPLCFYFITKRISYHLAHHHLHSTMLLLYRKHPEKAAKKNRRIYIPLCFYFIPLRLWHRR